MLDDELEIFPVADQFLREARLGRDQAELTTKAQAGGIVLFLRWCQASGRDWRTAAADMGLFMTWLKFVPTETAAVVMGPGMVPVRGERRVNNVLTSVRGFLAFAVTIDAVPRRVLGQIYELADDRDLPSELRGEDNGLHYRLRARHRLREPERPVDRATSEEIVALFLACRSARDRLIVLLMARAGLRRSEVVGLRRSDVHLLPSSVALGCAVQGEHLHVVRRDNINGAWAKSRQPRPVPVDFLLVQAFDQYEHERLSLDAATTTDFLLVNLFRRPLGAPMRPGALNELVTALVLRSGISRVLTPHMLRHAFASDVADAGGSLDEIQKLLGHRRASSSDPYVHPAQHRLRAAVERVPTPRALREGALR
ncbi:tyrosine-type recombinase/integrase [Amycolatopsis sp. cmx-4-68]|uniref:tyrosine-type recombinase/integrase n=1 Tax=Amycolatopsis sp. cmx-4-68 TaxID=2790938 RepID=UPI00397CFC0C